MLIISWVPCGDDEYMSQFTHRGCLASYRPGLTVLGESSLVSGARGGPLESRNALEVFLQDPFTC